MPQTPTCSNIVILALSSADQGHLWLAGIRHEALLDAGLRSIPALLSPAVPTAGYILESQIESLRVVVYQKLYLALMDFGYAQSYLDTKFGRRMTAHFRCRY